MERGLRRVDLLTVLAVTAAWGVAFVGIKEVLVAWPPLTAAGIRFLLSGFLLVCLLRGMRRTGRRPTPREAIVVGLLQTSGLYAGSFLGIERSTAGVASLLVNMGSLWVALLAVPLLGDRLTSRTIGGLAVALAGLALISIRSEAVTPAGLIFLVGGSFAWAFGSIAIKRLTAGDGVDPAQLAAWQMLAGAIPLLLLGVVLEHRLDALDMRGWLWFAYLVIPTGALAFGAWFRVLARYGAGPISAWLLLIPVWGVIAGAIVLSEPVTWRLVAGGALVLFGVLLAGTSARETVAADPAG